MKKRSTRWLRTVVLALVPTSLVAASFVLVPGAAYAAGVPSITTMGGNINVLPSAVDAATGSASGLSKADMMAVYMYRASKSPEFWALYAQAQKQAASTGKELVLSPELAAEAKTVYPTATKVAPLVKTVGRAAGTAGAVITAYEVGSKVTNGTLDLVGIDATGTVCSSTGRDLWGLAVQTAAGANCSGYDQKMQEEFQRNADAVAGFTGEACSQQPDEGCASMAGRVPWGSNTSAYCFSLVGFKPSFSGDIGSAPGFQYVRGDAQVRSSLGTAYKGDEQSRSDPCPRTSGWIAPVIIPSETSIEKFCYGTRKTDCTEGDYKPIGLSTADPQRTLQCVVAGTDGKKYTAESDPFFESAGVLPDPKCPTLPAGVMGDTIDLVEKGGSNGDDPIWSAKASDAVKNALTGGCGTSAATQCELELLKDGKSCAAGADCEGWFKDPDKSKYECRYGGKAVSLSECTTYAPRWEPEQQKTGNTLGDPKTGEPLTNPRPSLDPSTAPGVGASPADAELGGYNCWPTGWGAFNPLNWVLQPIKCAFVPREGYPKTLQKATTKGWAQTSPAKWGAAMQAWDLRTPGNGCSGIPVSMHYGVLNFDANILAACPGDVLAPFAGWSRLFVGFSLSVVGVFALVRWGGALFGFEGLGRKSDDD